LSGDSTLSRGSLNKKKDSSSVGLEEVGRSNAGMRRAGGGSLIELKKIRFNTEKLFKTISDESIKIVK
jgi:hypothetical protein